MTFSRLVRFVPKSNPQAILLGEPVDSNLDVGVATRKGQEVQVRVFEGDSALALGSLTEKVEVVARLLSPLSQKEVGTIRCIGLNVRAGFYGVFALETLMGSSISNMRLRSRCRCRPSRRCSCKNRLGSFWNHTHGIGNRLPPWQIHIQRRP
jgi:hypothetical protein